MKKLLLLIKFIIALFKPDKTDKLLDEMEDLNEVIQKKRQSMSDALLAGNVVLFHKYESEWLRLCKKRGNLRRRLPKNSNP